MACVDIGEADADIAGIGVVTAFAFQSVVSFILSAILDVLLPDPLNHESLHSIRQAKRGLLGIASLGDEIRKIEQDLAHLSHQVEEKAHHFRSLSTTLASFREDTNKYLQDFRKTVLSQDVPQKLLQENIHERSPRQEARSIIAEILYMSSDTQTLAGIALALTGIIRQKSLSLYQFHVIYDTINFTSISNCAALASASGVDTSDLLSRALLMAVFAVLYLVFVIVFGVHLGQWDNEIQGHCYDSHHIALPNAQHPYVDRIYLGITCMYMYVVLLFALFLAISRCTLDPDWSPRRSALVKALIRFGKAYTYDTSSQFTSVGSWVDWRGLNSVIWYPLKILLSLPQANPILFAAILQLPLHLYFLIRLRLTNEPLLSNGNDENQWGFGQIYTLIMSAGLVVECCKGYIKYQDAKGKFHNRDENKAGSEDKVGVIKSI